MKILHVSHFFPPHIGGGETYGYNLCKELVKAGHEVEVITSNIPKSRDYEVMDGIKVLRLPAKLLFFTPIMPSLLSELFNNKRNPDIIHSCIPPPYTADVAAFFSKVRKIPYILTYYTDMVAPTPSGNVLKNLYYLTIGKETLGTTKKIITTTKIIKNTSNWLKPVKNKIEVIPNGVDLTIFAPNISGQEIRQKYQIADNDPILLFVGRLTFYKGVECVLQALPIIKKKINNVRLIIVGKGYLENQLKALCASLGIEKSVIFAGRVSDNVLPKYYAAADVFVLPSTSIAEGFGIVLLEAMASGKPIVASNVGGIPEVIIDGFNGILVPPNVTKDLAESIIHLLANTDISRAMGHEGRRMAEKCYGWKNIADHTLSLYKESL